MGVISLKKEGPMHFSRFRRIGICIVAAATLTSGAGLAAASPPKAGAPSAHTRVDRALASAYLQYVREDFHAARPAAVQKADASLGGFVTVPNAQAAEVMRLVALTAARQLQKTLSGRSGNFTAPVATMRLVHTPGFRTALRVFVAHAENRSAFDGQMLRYLSSTGHGWAIRRALVAPAASPQCCGFPTQILGHITNILAGAVTISVGIVAGCATVVVLCPAFVVGGAVVAAGLAVSEGTAAGNDLVTYFRHAVTATPANCASAIACTETASATGPSAVTSASAFFDFGNFINPVDTVDFIDDQVTMSVRTLGTAGGTGTFELSASDVSSSSRVLCATTVAMDVVASYADGDIESGMAAPNSKPVGISCA